MTDESDATIIKNGINGAVAGIGGGGGGGGGSVGVVATTATAIHVSRGNAINLSSGSGSSAGGASANSQRMQYTSGGCPSAGSELSPAQSNQESSATAHVNSSGNSNSVESVRSPNTGYGGRLQFFKDGKFILELARSREGERSGWVSVPRKTFWPPSASTTPATNSTYPKNESSTSLSFSDDNSSIQSSPWQRDHCWKQATPRRSISKEMCMFFKRTKKFTLSLDGYKTAQLKRRRPHDNSMCKIPFTLVKNGFIKTELIDSVDIKTEVDEADGHDDDEKRKKSPEVDGAPAVKMEDGDVSRKKGVDQEQERRKPKTRAKLSTILEKLIDRLPTGLYYLSKVNPPPSSGMINHFPASARITELHNHQQHVSPRKRILREFEKVSLEDNSTKRSRAKANATNALATPASPSSNSSISQIASSTSTQRSTSFSNSSSTNNNNSQVSNGNGNSATTDANSNSNSNRLYSSYSIHSLLGNTTSNSKNESNSKDHMDSSCLQIMLTSPNSSETYYSNRSTYTSNSSKRKSPNYSATPDPHNRRSSRESPNNYGPNYPSESSLSPDPVSRYKQSGNAGTGATSFHPYLSSPKYSSNAASPTMVTDGYKQKSGYSTGSPSHSQVPAKMPTSRSPVVPSYSQQSPHSSKSSNPNNNRFREQSPAESPSPSSSSSDRRDGTPRTVPKKTVAFRQQFSSPTSSPSVVQTSAAESSNIYKSPSEQKRKSAVVDDQRTLSPESSKLYQSALDQLDPQHRTNLIRASPVLPQSPFYYLHQPHGSPGPHTSQPSYIPPLPPYYPITPYAAAVAALRNPLWMHYQTAGLLPGPSSRIPFPYNGDSGLGPPHPPTAPPGLSSMHLSSGPMPIPSWPSSSLNMQNSATDDPVSLVNVKDEHNADVPLNLSKH
ncbi:unnamed protein product [Hermetia illucens]|uniref:Uncharacterized protein n=2 Tax=Hermetia illucens TaxID=343691 RepID=A0A7R8V5V4_HERIL|nr:unnamed protein product [Hermetia illucens]